MNRTYLNWTEEDDRVLELYIKIDTLSYNEIAKKMGRTEAGLRSRAKKLNLYKKERKEDGSSKYSLPWTQEEEKILKQEVPKGTAFIEIAKLLPNRTVAAIHARSQSLNLESSYIYRIYDHDDYFFTNPNLINSYFAGFMSADGCVHDDNHISLSLSTVDKHILEEFKTYLKFTGEVRDYTRECNIKGIKYNDSKYSTLDLHSCYNIVMDLKNNFGVEKDKTYRIEPPNLKDLNLKLAFLIGYIDGDGAIFLSQKNGLTINITSATKKVLEWIKNLIVELKLPEIKKSKKESIISNHGNNLYRYVISGYKAVYFFNLLKILNTPKLTRKWNNPEILAIVEEKLKKFDNNN